MKRNQIECQKDSKEKMKKCQYCNNDIYVSDREFPWLLKEQYMLLHRRILKNSYAPDGNSVVNTRRKSWTVVVGNGQ